MTVYLRGMQGLGDTFYMRAVINALDKQPKYLQTSWPQLFADMPHILPVRPDTQLRTQARNVREWDGQWHVPHGIAPVTMGYADDHRTMLASIMWSIGMANGTEGVVMDGPARGLRPVWRPKYVIVRPATVRKEWVATARNPDPEYIDRAARAADAAGFDVISVADIDGSAERVVGDLPFAHVRFDRGDLSIDAMLDLVAGASGIIGGVGWAVPAAVAYKAPMLLLYGGWGYANGPQRIFDPRMDASRIVEAMPDDFCMCNDRNHNCPRVITNLETHIERFISAARSRATDLAA